MIGKKKVNKLVEVPESFLKACDLNKTLNGFPTRSKYLEELGKAIDPRVKKSERKTFLDDNLIGEFFDEEF